MVEELPESVLEDARREIDGIDRKMAELFSQRMEAVARIAAYKDGRGLPIYNAEREAEMLERNATYVSEDIRPHYQRLLESMMAESRQYQHRLIEEQD